MPVDQRNALEKQPSEIVNIDIDYNQFGNIVPLGASHIVSATASAIGYPKRQVTNTHDATLEVLISTIPVVVGKYNRSVRVGLKAGTNDYDYKITVLATWDNGTLLEDDLILRVREK